MVFNPKLQRGAQDRSFTPIKVAVHKESTHQQLLKTCISSVWREIKDGGYFLSDGSGHKITDKDFSVTGPNGEEESILWTFENYVKASSVRYPSRAHIYCVFVREDKI